MKNNRALIAEFIGTFILVFLGCASVWATGVVGYAAGPLLPAFAHGLSVVIAAYSIGNISGAHLNPAVSFGLAFAGAISWAKAASYAAVQVLAAVMAAFVLGIILPGDTGRFGAFFMGKTPLLSGFLTEMILTFILVWVVLHAAVRGKAKDLAGLVIGLTLVACILAGGSITGASLNPARTLGPGLVNMLIGSGPIGDYINHLPIYVLAQISGGVLAAVVEKFVLAKD